MHPSPHRSCYNLHGISQPASLPPKGQTPSGVSMTSRDTHCLRRTMIGELYVLVPVCPLCGPFAGVRLLGLQVSDIVLPEPLKPRIQIGAFFIDGSFDMICQWLCQPDEPKDIAVGKKSHQE